MTIAATYKADTEKPLHFSNLTDKTMIYQFFYLLVIKANTF
jgi:hypothetical protein